MKKISKLALCLAIGATTLTGFTACSDDNSDPSTETTDPKDAELAEIGKQYIDNTIYETYGQLSTETDNLFNQLYDLKADWQAGKTSEITDERIQKICETFLKARAWYEKSEAFLYGAATDFGIDPHIDTWPLDLKGLATALSNTDQVAAMDDYDDNDGKDPKTKENYIGDQYAGNKLGPELLGFHGIEFIIFREGKPRTAKDLMDGEEYNGLPSQASKPSGTVTGLNEVIFATAVAGDLRNKCFQMEVSWNADAPKDRIDKVESLEWPMTVNGGDSSYGQNFLAAGQAGSTYASWRKAAEAILVAGCSNIANEVGNTKMGTPHTGEDVNYIESPYSENSRTDFTDNIISIENSYMGGVAEKRDESKSLHAYLQKYNPDLDTKLVAAIKDAQDKIQAIPQPFVDNYKDEKVQTAIDACNTLNTLLNDAAKWILNN